MGCGPGFEPRCDIAAYIDDHHDLAGRLDFIDLHLHVLDYRSERYLDDHHDLAGPIDFIDDEFVRFHHYVANHDNDHKSGELTPPLGLGPHQLPTGTGVGDGPGSVSWSCHSAPRAMGNPNPVRYRSPGYG
jgi:hypothetical protein